MDDIETVLSRSATLVQVSRGFIAVYRNRIATDVQMMDLTRLVIHRTIRTIQQSDRTMGSYGALARTDGAGRK